MVSTRERSTQVQSKHKANHKSTRGVTTKWEDNPFTHKTKGVTTRWEDNPFYLSLNVHVFHTITRSSSSPYKEGSYWM